MVWTWTKLCLTTLERCAIVIYNGCRIKVISNTRRDISRLDTHHQPIRLQHLLQIFIRQPLK